MKKKIIIISITLIILICIYVKIAYPLLQEIKIRTYLENKWNVTVNSKDKFIIFKENEPDWHGEQQKFMLIEANNTDEFSNYVNKKNTNNMNVNMIKRISEIEGILNIEKEDRVDFDSDYYYKTLIIKKHTLGSEQKNDLLYFISIEKDSKLKVFFIEDLNVLDLERSKFK